ncbi:hypothetical protein [Streptomyces sp. 900105755]
MTVPALTPAQLSAFRLLLHDVRRVADVDLVVGTFMDTGAGTTSSTSWSGSPATACATCGSPSAPDSAARPCC